MIPGFTMPGPLSLPPALSSLHSHGLNKLERMKQIQMAKLPIK